MRAIAQQENAGGLPKKTSPIALLHCAKRGRVVIKAIAALEIAEVWHQRTSPIVNQPLVKQLLRVTNRIVDRLENPRHA